MRDKEKTEEQLLKELVEARQQIAEYKQMEIEFRKVSRIVEQSPASVIITDASGNIEYVNPKFTQLTGYTLKEVMGKNPRFLKSGEMSPKAYKQMWNTIASGNEWRGEFHNQKKNGELYWELASISPIRNLEGVITHFLAVKENITERKQVKEKLQASETKNQAFLSAIPDMMFEIRLDGTFLSFVPAEDDAPVIPANEFLGKKIGEVMPPAFAQMTLHHVKQALQSGETQIFEYQLPSPIDGKSRDYEARIAVCGTNETLSIVRNVTEQKRLEAQLRHLATHDELTGLFNRRYLMERLTSAVNSAKRYEHPLSLCLCDLDQFKSINDTYGHSAGDDVLIGFSDLLKLELRTVDFAGRFGGDEFCIIFSHTATTQSAISVERIRKALKKQVFEVKDGGTFSVSGTFGIADLNSKEMTENDLLDLADQALYQAKKLGRNRVSIANSR